MMIKTIKQRINERLCKYFGHKVVDEVYAVRCDNLFGFLKVTAKRQNIFIGYLLTRDANVAEMSNAL